MKPFLKTILFCQKEVWDMDKKLFFYNYLLTIPRAFNTLLWSLAIKNLIDVAVDHSIHPRSLEIYELKTAIITISIFLTLAFLGSAFNRYLDDKLNRNYTHFYKRNLARKIESLDLQVFEDTKFLDNLSKAQGNHTSILKIYNESLSLFRFFIQTLVATISLISLNFVIPILIIIIESGIIIYRNKFNAKYRDLDRSLIQTKRKEGNYLGLFFGKQSIEEMRIYGLNDFVRKKVDALNENIVSQLLNLVRKRIAIFGFLNLIETSIIELGSRIYAFWAILNSRISVGDFYFYNNQIGTLSSALYSLGQSINAIFRESLEVEYTQQIYQMTNNLDYSKANKKLNTDNFIIKFENISFAYPGVEDRFILKNFNLEIQDGEKLAIIGTNGAGKSTLIKLLLRYYDPLEGNIFINGVNLKELDIKWWYSQIGVLFQDFMKYDVTVRENVGYGNIQNIDDLENIEDALAKSSSDVFVNEYPSGIEQTMGRLYDDSIQPSGGQWQKIALARTFFRDAPILILDEPTSAIDAKAEAEIFEKVENLSKDKTVIIISHRFSTVRNADRIVVVEEGRIIEEGHHNELIEKKGKYAELFELQAKGYK